MDDARQKRHFVVVGTEFPAYTFLYSKGEDFASETGCVPCGNQTGPTERTQQGSSIRRIDTGERTELAPALLNPRWQAHDRQLSAVVYAGIPEAALVAVLFCLDLTF